MVTLVVPHLDVRSQLVANKRLIPARRLAPHCSAPDLLTYTRKEIVKTVKGGSLFSVLRLRTHLNSLEGDRHRDSLASTDLVNEVYLRLIDVQNVIESQSDA